MLGMVALVSWFMVDVVTAAQLPDFTVVVDNYGPAVVNISTTQKKSKGNGLPHGKQMPRFPEGTPFDEFFRRYYDEDGSGNGEPRDFEAKSLGSGFIISADGYILTNNHVVKDADEVIVRLRDRREIVAKVIGTDERSDVALLKIKAENLPMVKIGDSSKLRVGEWVLAIGSPFDFDYSVTAGIVSAVGRSLPNENYVPFIQTDVAINPGNSGGPLFNMDGEVVGINSQIYSRTGGFMGLSFTIPIDLAMDVTEQLKKSGHVSRGWLGVLIQDVTRELAESFGMDKPGGALVSQILPKSPAEKAGFKVGDVITEFNGREVTGSAVLPPMVGTTPIDRKVPVKVIRDGKTKTLQVMIGELPPEEQIEVAAAPSKNGGTPNNRLKIEVAELTPAQRKEVGIEKNGVLVKSVKEGPAHSAGIREGDVLMMINNTEVKSLVQFKELVDGLPTGKSVPVLVQRQGGPAFVALKLNGKE
jgi:serine protease Do